MTRNQREEIAEEVAKALMIPVPRVIVRVVAEPKMPMSSPLIAPTGKWIRIAPLALQVLTPAELRFGISEKLSGRTPREAVTFAGILTVGIGVSIALGWLVAADAQPHPLLGVLAGCGALAVVIGVLSVAGAWQRRARYVRSLQITQDVEAAREYLSKQFAFDWDERGAVPRSSPVLSRLYLKELQKAAFKAGIR